MMSINERALNLVRALAISDLSIEGVCPLCRSFDDLHESNCMLVQAVDIMHDIKMPIETNVDLVGCLVEVTMVNDTEVLRGILLGITDNQIHLRIVEKVIKSKRLAKHAMLSSSMMTTDISIDKGIIFSVLKTNYL
jgi:hypothetical protein